MKKILSLLALLVMTLTAFATDYTGHRTVTFGSMPSTESDDAVLTITDNGDNTFNVTFKDVINVDGNYTDNYGTYTFSNVAGTTENGVTTIDLSNLSASVENCALGLKEASDGVLFAKFNAEKAYAKFSAKIGTYYKSTISAEFGVNDFESTGGGSTGGGDEKPAAFEKVDFVGDGTNFNWSIPVDWDTQKIVMSISTATCTTGCEHIIGLGVDGTSWAGNLHMYRTSDDKQLQCYFGAGAINTGKFDEGNPIKVEISKANGFIVDGTTKITAEQLADLFAMSTVVMGTGESNNILSHATYNYVKVVDKDWTETTEPEVTVTFEKQYADKLYSLADGTPSAMGDATVTLKEMSDNTISMSLAFSEMNVESTDLVKGTDEKDRITYTGTTNFQGTNFAVKALRYTKDEEEKLYMTLIPTEGTTLAFGEDPDYVAPAEPEDVTLWENYQADGTGFSKTATINWDKQKIVASIDFSNGGDDKDILAMTTGDSFAAFQTSTYRTMHWYCQQSVKQMSGFFAKSGSGNNNTGRMDVADCLTKFEISKAEGLKVNGEVKMSPEVLDELFASNTVLIGSGESPKFSKAFYNYIKVVSLDWTEPTTPDTPMPVVYNNTLKVVRGTDTKTYEDAPVSVIDEGEGKYTVTIPSFSDMDSAEGTTPGTIGKLTFVADGVEADGKLKLTASSVETTQEGGEGWESQTFTASMDATVTGETLAGTFTVKVNDYESMYTYNLYYGVEAPEVVTEVANNNYTSNLRIIDQTSEDENTYLFQTDEASVNIIKYSDHTYKITLRNITLNEKTSDLVFTGAEVDSDEGGAVVTDETMVQATADAETQNFLGGAVVAQFMWQDVSATEIRMSFVLEGTTLSLAGEFNYEEETPDQPKDDYAINFDKDAKQNHSSRYSISVSLQQTGKDKQTIEFGKTMNGYEDLTAEKFTVEAGSEVTPSIGYVGEWMHGYVYIDLDNNKQFSFNADGADQTGTEVVSYSYYKDQNSKGETVASSCNVNPMPAFTAPTEPGTYRIRFKVDWDNIDAGGSVASGNYILNNGGGIYDATLEVVEPVVDGISTINAEVANGEAQLFTVDGVQIAKLQKGLNIVRTADGKVKKVLVK